MKTPKTPTHAGKTPPSRTASTDNQGSPKTPAQNVRKNTKKTTPVRNFQKTSKSNFNLGSFSKIEDDKLGKVKKAKMTIEDRVRKEKRDKMMEDTRKPIILTPGSKRGRHDEEEWEQPQPGTGAAAASQEDQEERAG